jgi:hypothetical protein
MKTYFIAFLCVLAYRVHGQEQQEAHYDERARDHNDSIFQAKMYADSLLLFETYESEIDSLTAYVTQKNAPAWYARQAHDESVTLSARSFLEKMNKRDYLADSTLDFESFGGAFHYPKPERPVNVAVGMKHWNRIIDSQTRFLCNASGKTRIPYIVATYYENGKKIKSEKLNPLTKEPL